MGGVSPLVGLVTFAVAQRLWGDWPLRVLDTVGMPRWEQTRASLLFLGASCVVMGLLYLRARGLPSRHLLHDLVLEPAQSLDLTLHDVTRLEVLRRVHREPDTMGSAGQDHIARLERHAARQVVDEVGD